MTAQVMMNARDNLRLEHRGEENMDIDSEESPQISRPHPLLIDHVVENIFRHLIVDQKDDNVLESRLVCHLWDDIATNALHIHSNKTLHFGKYFRSPEILLKFIHYLQTSGSMNHFPLGKFYLCEDIFKQCHLSTVQTFFADCSSLITALTLRLDNQSDLKVSQVKFDKLTLSRLKCLVFDDRRLPSGNSDANFTASDDSDSTLLEEIVKRSPNLELLTIIHPPSSMFDDDETALLRRTESEKNVANMLVNHCPPCLTSLNLDIKLNDTVLQSLSKIPARLRELRLCLRESVFSKESLNQLLDKQKDHLRSLRLCSMGTKSHFEVTFPVLPDLQLLELHSWDSLIQGVTFSAFTYDKHFPSLKSLVLHTWAENPTWIKFFPAAYYGTVPTVTSLKLPQNFMYPAMIQNLSWLYPNLKSIDVHFSKQTGVIIQRIFGHFGDHLEELKIRDSLPREKIDICLDSLFTGLPQSTCEKILRNKWSNPDEELNCVLKLKQKPSLLNLKNLRKLDIEDVLRHGAFLTDVTGYLLLKLPSLRYLIMGRSQIDDECLEKLAKRYPSSMEKELLVPKPPQRRIMMSSTKASMISAYHYCTTSLDLVNNCAIC